MVNFCVLYTYSYLYSIFHLYIVIFSSIGFIKNYYIILLYFILLHKHHIKNSFLNISKSISDITEIDSIFFYFCTTPYILLNIEIKVTNLWSFSFWLNTYESASSGLKCFPPLPNQNHKRFMHLFILDCVEKKIDVTQINFLFFSNELEP